MKYKVCLTVETNKYSAQELQKLIALLLKPEATGEPRYTAEYFCFLVDPVENVSR